MALLMAVLNVFPGLFLGIFGQSDDFVEAGLGTLRIVSAAMVLVCAGVIWLNAVIATGRTTVVFWIEFWGIVGYLAYVWVVIEVLKLSLEAAWMSEWLYWSTMLILSFTYMRYGNWRNHLAFGS
jgi:Na+-driven multidrug efflux pump